MKLIGMKKSFLLFLILFSTQLIYAQRFGGGFYGGMAGSQVDGDSYGGYHKVTPVLGAYTNTSLTDKIDLQLELNYLEKGSKAGSNDPTLYYHCKLDYIQLPVVLKYNVYDKWTAELGLAGGYLFNEQEDKDGGGFLEPDPAFKKYEISGIAGIYYSINDRFEINVRFNYSILPVREHPGEQVYYLNRGAYNNVMGIAVYYTLGKQNK